MSKQDNTLLLIDTNSLIHRAYHAYPLTLINAKGEPVNAVYGVTSMLLDVLLKLKPKYVIAVFDSKGPTFRHKEYTGYKAHRPKADSELSHQFKGVKEIIQALNIPIIEAEGFEADDLIGTITKLLEDAKRSKKKTQNKHPDKIHILTNDKDIFQLVTDYVNVLAPYKRFQYLTKVDANKVKEILGVLPKQVIDYKALVGDPSDNIPGVKGVGPKTAVALLQQYKTLEAIYKNLGKIQKQKPALYRKLSDDYQNAQLSKQLATIKRDVPLRIDLDKALLKDFDIRQAYNVFLEYQFKSLLPKLSKLYETLTGKEISQKVITRKPSSVSIKKFIEKQKMIQKPDINTIISLLQQAKDSRGQKSLVFAFYNDMLYYGFIQEERLVKTDFCPSPVVGYNVLGLIRALFKDTPKGILEKKLPGLFTILNDLKQVSDIKLCAYGLITGRTSYELQDLSNMYLNSLVDTESILDVVLNIAFKQYKQIQNIDDEFNKHLLTLTTFIDPIVMVAVVLMEHYGICIDLEKVKKYHQVLEDKLMSLEKDIYEQVGFEFNVRSSKQLASVLFDVLKLTPSKKRKTGFSTDINTLTELKGSHPVIDLLIEYRKLQKIYSTYVKPFLEGKYFKHSAKVGSGDEKSQLALIGSVQRNDKTSVNCSRIHTQFNPIRTSTGRFASSNPNMQNLPKRSEEGAKVREFFVPSAGNIFISFDYSQIDLRVLAHTSQDEHLIEAFINDQDIHKETASKIFNKPYEEITDKERRVAKTINFGIVYGMSPYGLAKSLGLEYREAQMFLDAYFEQFPKVKEYMKKTEEFVIKHGFVLSLFGRRRYIFGITSNNANRRQAAFREAINMPIQGGSDDIMRKAIATILMQDDAVKSGIAKLILQIHDELVFEVPNSKKFTLDWAKAIKNIMENVLEYPPEFRVPLKVEYEVKVSL